MSFILSAFLILITILFHNIICVVLNYLNQILYLLLKLFNVFLLLVSISALIFNYLFVFSDMLRYT